MREERNVDRWGSWLAQSGKRLSIMMRDSGAC
jgi:hypothetical protein